MHRGVRAREIVCGGTVLLILLACAKLLLHLSTSGHYGYFRDELYYMACGEHLAWGYVDQPPLIAVIARLSRGLLGDSLLAIRFLPGLAGASVIFLTGSIARELGGSRYAQFLSTLAMLFAPAYLAFDSFLSMNAFEPVFWTACALLVILILKGADERLWILVGAISGVGLLNKHTMLLFGLALVAGLLLTEVRSQLRSKWLWLGGLVALAIFLPHLIWQATHHWPQIETVRNAQQFKNSPVTPVHFLLEQILFLHPLTLPLWLGGLGWLLYSRDGKPFRALSWIYLIVLAACILLRGKTYYPLPAYPILIAAGGVCLEGLFRTPALRWLRVAFPGVLVAGGIVTLPFGVPVLPVKTFVRYEEILPLARPVKMERDRMGPLPQLYADMFGWPEMVATVSGVYRSLTPAEQAKCAILTGNYGEAAAIDFFGKEYGLPKAISGHNNYYLWGPREYTGEVVISLGVSYQDLERLFGEIEPAAVISNPYAMLVENDLPVYICRKPKAPLPELWPMLKYYI